MNCILYVKYVCSWATVIYAMSTHFLIGYGLLDLYLAHKKLELPNWIKIIMKKSVAMDFVYDFNALCIGPF